MAYEINDYQRAAIDTYAQAARLDPAEFKWPYFQALLIAKFGDSAEALEVLDAAIAIDGNYAPAWLWRGSWTRDLGRFDEALVAFARASELGARKAAEAGVAQTYLRQSRNQEALELLIPLAARTKHSHIYRLLGRAHQIAGNAEDARVALARGRSPAPLEWRDPRHVEKWQFLASYGGRLVHAERLLESGQFEDVIEVLEPMYQTYPEDEAVVANLAMALGRQGQLDRALALVERGLRHNPDYFRFHNVLASLYFHRDELAQATEHLNESIAVNPAQAWPHRQLGTIFMRDGRYDEALAAFDEALANGVENPEQVHHTAGMIEGARERWPEAVERFRRATAIDEAFTMAFVYLARSLAEGARFEEASRALAWADRLDTHPQERRGARIRLKTLQAAAKRDETIGSLQNQDSSAEEGDQAAIAFDEPGAKA